MLAGQNTGKRAGRIVQGADRWGRLLAVMLALALMVWAGGVSAQGNLGAQARLLPDESAINASRNELNIVVALSQPVPYRLRVLAAPPRLVIDLNTVDWGTEALAVTGGGVRAQRLGHLPDGWARMVLDLAAPYLPETTEQKIDLESGQARIALRLARVPLEEFERGAQSESALVAATAVALLHPDEVAPPVQAEGPRRPVIMLDPGHGGIDPGAERDGMRESDLVLDFARILREVLLRRGLFEVAMTRDADVFVSLDGRIRAARAARADLFVSLHADALPEGMASGTIVYVLDDEASDDSAAYLAERHDRGDMLAGVDLAGNTDEIARVLMSVAWQDTAPRARALAESLVAGVGEAGLRLHRRPVQAGAFTVLRAVDMPSVLIELGFMSNPRDLAALRDPEWHAQMAEVLADALEVWWEEDRALEGLRRK